MRPVTLNTTGVSVSPVCPLDFRLTPFQVTLDADVTGAATYTVEYTSDDVFATTFNPATALWHPVTGMSGAAADAEATLISPVRGVRVNQTAGAGSVRLTVIQAGF